MSKKDKRKVQLEAARKQRTKKNRLSKECENNS